MSYAIRIAAGRTPGFLNEVQQAVWGVNPQPAARPAAHAAEIYDESMAQTSFALVILGIAAAVTLLLGFVGIYGVIAYIVVAADARDGHPHGARRQRQPVQRCSCGAASADRHRARRRRRPAAGGMRLLSALLFGVSPFDPLTYGAVILALASVALLATWLPARQATRMDPSTALRAEEPWRG